MKITFEDKFEVGLVDGEHNICEVFLIPNGINETVFEELKYKNYPKSKGWKYSDNWLNSAEAAELDTSIDDVIEEAIGAIKENDPDRVVIWTYSHDSESGYIELFKIEPEDLDDLKRFYLKYRAIYAEG